MTLIPLQFRSGIVRDQTDYTNKGGWFDSDKVRFRKGLPEKIGGWIRFSLNTFVGTARSLFGWATLRGEKLYGLGTNLKYYIVQGGGFIDITPLRRTVTLTTDPLSTLSIGSTAINVFDDDNGAKAGDYVTLSGATGPVGGVPAEDINREHSIVEVIDSDNYRIDVATAAISVESGGGSTVTAEYQITTGLNTTLTGLGWGSSSWGEGGWGEASEELTTGEVLRLWHQDKFGEDLIFNVRMGAIYYKDVSAGLSVRGTALQAMPGAVDVPVVAMQVMVSNNDRHVLAFGCNDIGSTELDCCLIRWSNRENAVNWDPINRESSTFAPTAGSLRINVGSGIIRAIETQREILLWTDVSLHSLRYRGVAAGVFGQEQVGANISLIAPNAVIAIGSETYWMGDGTFYKYDGRIQEIPCDIEEYVFRNLTELQRPKIYAGSNKRDSEVWWFVPFGDALDAENNVYVIHNFGTGDWYFGTMDRTAWIDSQFEPKPLAASTDGYLYQQETGWDDGSTEPASPITAFVESSLTEIGDGEQFMFVRKLIPDVTFDGSSASNPSVTISMTPRNYPGGSQRPNTSSSVSRTTQVPVEQYDEFKSVRLRGRMLTYKVRSDGLGVAWRHGTPRLDATTAGRK